MNNIEKIKAEIERRKKENMYDDLPMTIGRYYEDRDLLAFIDSLPEEKPSEDLEEAAARYERENRESILSSVDIVNAFIAGAEWQKEQMELDGIVTLTESDFDAEKEKASEWGYNLCKEQMMKDAIHYVVQDDLDPHGVSYNIPFIRIGRVALEPKGIVVGDKVKIIIVKQDDRQGD